MRTLWKAVSFLAVVNLLALLLVIGWLWHSGRLTRERAGDIRAMLATTVTQAKDDAGRLATEAEAARLLKQQDEMRAHPPSDAASQITQIALVHRQTEESRQRLDDERRILADQLQQATTKIEADAEALRRQQAATGSGQAAEMQRKSNEQFLRAVKQLEQVPPKQAKKMLETLVSEKKMDQAVAYLDAMNSRAASKVLREFKSDADAPLATELLERLRTRGVESEGAAPPMPSSGPASPSKQESSANAALSPASPSPASAAVPGDKPRPGNNAAGG